MECQEKKSGGGMERCKNQLKENQKHFRIGKTQNYSNLRKVRQGDTSSPKLFTACLERAFRQLNWQEKGIRIDGEYLSHLRCADDIIIIIPTKEEPQQMLTELNEGSKSVGLHMNFHKTKVMSNKYTEYADDILEIENQQIEAVDHYIYLEQRSSLHDASKESEIKRRITLRWQAFGRASQC
ncbi:uncharacterized protein LOC135226628 [Macrobrachium nipponense]|uniref:uncharacterized protein LOC135226628 n=1 Tax=Macrobrachium nipponense TaxID=159736 RepID=UPI0030C7B3D2